MRRIVPRAVLLALLVFGPAPSAAAQDAPVDAAPRADATRADAPPAAAPDAQGALLGFRPERAEAQRALEQRALQLVEGGRLFDTLLQLTATPRLAGTHAQRESYFHIAHELGDLGWTIQPSVYQAWLPLPLQAEVTLTAPSVAGPFPGPESDGGTPTGIVMPHSGYGADGDVEAPLLYVNYGLPEDYDVLQAMGVSVAGRIVVARYGRSYRGVKVREAELRGALGVILYSDPADDGFVLGPVHPEGPHRPPGAVQRGSVAYGFLHPGDPLTPGRPALHDAARIDPAESVVLPRIPCLPLGWRDARELLAPLGGPPAPPDWRGGIPDLAYRIGRDDGARARLVVRSNWRTREIANVVAVLPGRLHPDELVLVGGHRDSWVFGAADNAGGVAVILELARVLSQLVGEGFRPDRTLVLGLWDAEEQNLIGSTEYVEERMDELRAGAVAYVNVDAPVTGDDFSASCSPALRGLVLEVARDLPALDGDGSLLDAWTRRLGAPPVPAGLGSGSDFGPFVQHAGVASAHVGFDGAFGPYHALQDDMAYVRTVDADMSRHVLTTRVVALLALRLAQADVPPLLHEGTADAVRAGLTSLAAELGAVPEDVTRAADAFAAAAADADAAARAALAGDASAERLAQLSGAWARAEQRYLDDAGLVGRTWFRHLLMSTSTVDGYATLALPGVTAALHGLGGDPDAEWQRLASTLDVAAEGLVNEARAEHELRERADLDAADPSR